MSVSLWAPWLAFTISRRQDMHCLRRPYWKWCSNPAAIAHNTLPTVCVHLLVYLLILRLAWHDRVALHGHVHGIVITYFGHLVQSPDGKSGIRKTIRQALQGRRAAQGNTNKGITFCNLLLRGTGIVDRRRLGRTLLHLSSNGTPTHEPKIREQT
jgi:hypothetical protein